MKYNKSVFRSYIVDGNKVSISDEEKRIATLVANGEDEQTISDDTGKKKTNLANKLTGFRKRLQCKTKTHLIATLLRNNIIR